MGFKFAPALSFEVMPKATHGDDLMSNGEVREFDGRVVFITGGARGFGKAFGQALGERGARIVLADINAAAAEAAAAELRAGGAQVLPVVCDVADEAQVEAAVAPAVAEYGGIDILINNVGLHSAAYAEPLTTSGIAKLRRLFDVNVMGVIICSLAGAPSHGDPRECPYHQPFLIGLV